MSKRIVKKGEIRRSNLNPNVEGNFTFKAVDRYGLYLGVNT